MFVVTIHVAEMGDECPRHLGASFVATQPQGKYVVGASRLNIAPMAEKSQQSSRESLFWALAMIKSVTRKNIGLGRASTYKRLLWLKSIVEQLE